MLAVEVGPRIDRNYCHCFSGFFGNVHRCRLLLFSANSLADLTEEKKKIFISFKDSFEFAARLFIRLARAKKVFEKVFKKILVQSVFVCFARTAGHDSILPHIHVQNDISNARISCVFIEGDKQREGKDCETEKEKRKNTEEKIPGIFSMISTIFFCVAFVIWAHAIILFKRLVSCVYSRTVVTALMCLCMGEKDGLRLFR